MKTTVLPLQTMTKMSFCARVREQLIDALASQNAYDLYDALADNDLETDDVFNRADNTAWLSHHVICILSEDAARLDAKRAWDGFKCLTTLTQEFQALDVSELGPRLFLGERLHVEAEIKREAWAMFGF